MMVLCPPSVVMLLSGALLMALKQIDALDSQLPSWLLPMLLSSLQLRAKRLLAISICRSSGLASAQTPPIAYAVRAFREPRMVFCWQSHELVAVETVLKTPMPTSDELVVAST
jgi:hypothetical protein